MPRRSRFCLENATPLPQLAATRGNTVLPISMPSTIATVSALKPCACSQAFLLTSMEANASAALSARPGMKRASGELGVAVTEIGEVFMMCLSFMEDRNEGTLSRGHLKEKRVILLIST